MLDNLIQLAKNQGWVMTPTNTGAQFANEDGFEFSVEAQANEDIADKVRVYASDFDVDAFVKAVAIKRYGNIAAIPSISELLKEGDNLRAQIADLASELDTSRLEAFAASWLNDHRHYNAKGNGMYEEEVYISQQDEPMSGAQVYDILMENRNDPDDPSMKEKFNSMVYEWWEEAARQTEDELQDDVFAAAQRELGLDEDDEVSKRILMEYIQEHVVIKLPCDFYLKGRVPVAIVVDTGDADSEFVLNCDHVPHYNSSAGPFDDKASLVWLATQQGYTREQLETALASEDFEADEGTFLGSVYAALNESHSMIGALTFLVDMSLEMAIQLEAQCRLSRTVEDAGSITLGTDTPCDLFDFQNGSGTCASFIHLDKDVVLPVKNIHWVRPDTSGRRSPAHNSSKRPGTPWVWDWDPIDVYGADESMYRDTVKGLSFPEEMRETLIEMLP